MFELHSKITRLKTYLVGTLNTMLVANGLAPIDDFRVGPPSEQEGRRTLGVFVHPEETAFESPRTDGEVAVAEVTFVVGMKLLSEDDNGNDSLLYKYSDVLIRTLSEYCPANGRSSLESYSPQHSYDVMRPDIFIQMTGDVSYEE